MKGSVKHALPHGLQASKALPMHLFLPRAVIILNLLPCDELPEVKSSFPISLQLLLTSHFLKDGDAGLLSRAFWVSKCGVLVML